MKKFFIVVTIEVLIAITLLTCIILKKRSKIFYSPISKQSVTFTQPGHLQYFYEPKANSLFTPNDWSPYKVTNTINSDNLNETEDYSVNKPPNTFRIITLGDSFTFGLYVKTSDNWTEVLERQLNQQYKCKNISKFEVINLGMEGYDIEYEAARYQLRGEKYHPDLVIWFIKLNNFNQDNEYMFKKLQIYSKDPANKGYDAWSKALKDTYNELGENYLIDSNRQLLTEFTSKFKIPIVFMTYKSTPDKYKTIFQTALKLNHDNRIFDSLTDTYKTDGMHFPTDWHPNNYGHRVIAFDLFNYLRKNSLLSCN